MTTGPAPGQPSEPRVIEPTRIIGPRRGSGSERVGMFRPVPWPPPPREQDRTGDGNRGPGAGPVPDDGPGGRGPRRRRGAAGRRDVPRKRPGTRAEPEPGTAPRREVAAGGGHRAGRARSRYARRARALAGRRRARVAVKVAAGGGAGFVLGVLLVHGGVLPSSSAGERPAAPPRRETAGTPSPPPAPLPAPRLPRSARPPAGDPRVLGPGDSGPAVSDLQRRLLRIPDVYPGGAVDGRYDRALAEAVARFQSWYGIRGDEEGVYGDDTRRDLESRS
ncbi:hypothetical protein GCM10027168_25000 [Streptomyces capparidis]